MKSTLNQAPIKTEKLEMLPNQELMKYLGLGEKELQMLKDRISGVKGHVRVAVHPLFSEKGIDQIEQSAHKKAYEHFSKSEFSAVSNQKSSPLFVFSEKETAEKDKVGKKVFLEEDTSFSREQINSSIVNLLTHSGFGIPFLESNNLKPEGLREDWRQTKDWGRVELVAKSSFDYLQKVFFSLGVKSLTASGMYISLDADLCLNTMVDELRSRNIKVDISPSSAGIGLSPKRTREVLKNAGVELKQTGKAK